MADLRIHANLALAAAGTFIPVCTACVGLRFYCRRLRSVPTGPDDWAVVAGLVFVIGMAVAFIVGEKLRNEAKLIDADASAELDLHRLGYPTPDPRDSVGQPDANYAFWPVEMLQIPALGFIKASFVLLYRRIFPRKTAPVFGVVNWVMLGLIVAWTISFFFSIIFICGTNFSAYWISTEVEARECVKTSELHQGLAISDFVMDVLIILLPIPLIWQLQLSTARKIGITAIFALGAVTIAASAMRMVIFIQATEKNYSKTIDFEFLCTSGLYWSMIETGLGLIAACLPMFPALLTSPDIAVWLRSLRTKASLVSISSSNKHSPNHTAAHHTTITARRASLDSSTVPMTFAEASRVESGDTESESLEMELRRVAPMSGNVITVKQTFGRDEEFVRRGKLGNKC